MNAEDEITPAGRAAELLARGSGDAMAGRKGLRGAMRRAVLRAMRPFTYHQRALDAEIVAALERQEALLAGMRERDGERIERLERLARELILTAETLRREISSTDARAASAADAIESVISELNAVPYMEGAPLESFHTPVGEVVGFRAADRQRDSRAEYAVFEDLFRGSGERVTRSQRPYLALLREHQPVLDLGCGRGELLALLAAEGIAASGVERDPAMVERCRARGVEVSLGDANEVLERTPDGSLGSVFSAQVIEHLTYEYLRRMLALARRKLKPGGLFIAETVNPHRISSLKTFWVDLTHEQPIFPEVALALCVIAGFESAYVFAPGYESFQSARFSAPAYAVVASAPRTVAAEVKDRSAGQAISSERTAAPIGE